jgi:16S rRNA processing protein RimM
MEDSLVWVGRIVKTWGIKGEIKISSPGGGTAAFSPGKAVCLENRQGMKKSLTVHASRPQGPFIILSFREIKRVEEAAELVGDSVYVPKESLAALPPDEFYDYQLRGLTVKTEGGVLLGILEEIIPTGAHDVFVVRKEGREVLFPATDEVVVRVDLREKVMVVRPLEGLLSEDDL